jgi:DNA-binding transcriptional LysR family regulator
VEIRQFEHFVAVAEERSFTRAARRLDYVQSALSVSIQSLERELGIRLLDRNTHRVELTDAGAALLPTVRGTLASVEQTRDVAAALKGVVRGTLRIGIMQAFAFLHVSELLGAFHRRHPEVEIQMRPSPGGSQAMLDELRHGGFDIVFAAVTDDPIGATTSDLGVEDFYVVGAKDLLPAGRARLGLGELSAFSLVDFPTGWGVRTAVDRAFAAAGCNRQVAIEVGDVGTFVGLVREGIGVALTPLSILPPDHRLEVRRLESPMSWRVVMALPSNRPVRAAAAAFADLVRQRDRA